MGGKNTCLSKPAVMGRVGYLEVGACTSAAGLPVTVAAVAVALSSRLSEEVEASRAASGATIGPPLVASAAVCCETSACKKGAFAKLHCIITADNVLGHPYRKNGKPGLTSSV